MEGFKRNIPPFIVGSIVNLDAIKWEDNNKKRTNCSVSLFELCEEYYEIIPVKVSKHNEVSIFQDIYD